MKVCFKCKKSKEKARFYKNKRNKDGLTSYCKQCSKEYQEKFRQTPKGKAYQKSNKFKMVVKKYKQSPRGKATIKKYNQTPKGKLILRKTHLLRNYGITLEDYDKMYNSQQGKCAICKDTYEILCIDHDHTTNKIRGLLCDKCNRGIGYLKESKEIFINAIKYLE